MIKCEVSVCAKINRSASVKKSQKDDSEFVTFGIVVPLVGRKKEKLDMEISVSLDGGKDVASVYTTGRRVSVNGTLSIRKKDGKMFFNLRADRSSIELVKSTEADRIEGSMEFRGKIKTDGVEEKKDKKENLYKVFSAFDVDKTDDKVEFIWVRFLYFNPKEGEDFLAAGQYIEAKGDLQLGVYREAVSLDCRLKEVSPWEPPKKKN